MAFRFALLADKMKPTPTLQGSLGEKRVAIYCRKVTIAWCLFFVCNGGFSLFSVFWLSDAAWALYNGGISYILIGTFFAIELALRKMTDKTLPKAIPLSAFTPNSRKADAVLCFSGTFSEKQYKTWKDFLAQTAALRKTIEATPQTRWILHCNDYWYFLLAYTALLQCKKEVLLLPNISKAYIAEIAADNASTTSATPDKPSASLALLCDTEEALALLECSFHVPRIVEAHTVETSTAQPSTADAKLAFPTIHPEEACIVIYTSGTTGKPKPVKQRLKELENDNAFVLSQWGEECLKRKVCSTTSPQHIYGLLFSVMLPFVAGIPFRRERIEFPETFTTLNDDSYLIVTVPALLKRAVEALAPPTQEAAPSQTPVGGGEKSDKRGVGLRSPWVFSSGGALPVETAAATEQVLGFWPVEIYGSTETAGIAWRQSKQGPEWRPFEKVHLEKNAEGCLLVKSPYIQNAKGFATGDKVQLLPHGRFLLEGRADMVVKIEEKRISLTEIENRLLHSPLVAEAAVVALEGKRQFLAAAVVLNEKGKAHFKGAEKFRVNQYFREYLQPFVENTLIPKRWRYVEALPKNPQGKQQKQALQQLFQPSENDLPPAKDEKLKTLLLPQGIFATVLRQTENEALVALAVPDSSLYFDGHFSGFQILPAVAQFELIEACAKQLFGPHMPLAQPGVQPSVHSARRLKFSTMVSPNMRLHLELQLEKPAQNAKQNLSFVRFALKSPDQNTFYSTGAIGYEACERKGL